MSQQTAPEDRIPFPHKVVYGIGGFVNNLLASAIGGMAIILTLALGVSPALVGLLGLFPRIFDAITDPLVGYISDNTKSRWGRRRPFIFVGAIFTGIVFALLWQIPAPAQFRLKLVDLRCGRRLQRSACRPGGDRGGGGCAGSVRIHGHRPAHGRCRA